MPEAPKSIFEMLATQFLAPQYASMESAQAPMPNRTAIPNFNQGGDSQFIDLGAGGPAPGSERSNALSSIGGIAQQLAPMLGAMMPSTQAKNAAIATRVAQTPGSATTPAFGLTNRQSWGG